MALSHRCSITDRMIDDILTLWPKTEESLLVAPGVPSHTQNIQKTQWPRHKYQYTQVCSDDIWGTKRINSLLNRHLHSWTMRLCKAHNVGKFLKECKHLTKTSHNTQQRRTDNLFFKSTGVTWNKRKIRNEVNSTLRHWRDMKRNPEKKVCLAQTGRGSRSTYLMSCQKPDWQPWAEV